MSSIKSIACIDLYPVLLFSLLGRFHGNDPRYKMGWVFFPSGTNRPPFSSREPLGLLIICSESPSDDFSACTRYKSMRKMVSVLNQSTEQMAAWDTVRHTLANKAFWYVEEEREIIVFDWKTFCHAINSRPNCTYFRAIWPSAILVSLVGTVEIFSALPMLVCASWHHRSKTI